MKYVHTDGTEYEVADLIYAVDQVATHKLDIPMVTRYKLSAAAALLARHEREHAGVTIPHDVALTIRRAFLPLNPNKMRSAAPEVVDAARQFIRAVEVPLALRGEEAPHAQH